MIQKQMLFGYKNKILKILRIIFIAILIIVAYIIFDRIRTEVNYQKYLKEHYAAQYEDLLFNMLDIDLEEIEKIAIIGFESQKTVRTGTRSAEEEETIERIVSMLNQTVLYEDEYDANRISGEPRCKLTIFLGTGERLEISIGSDEIWFINYGPDGEWNTNDDKLTVYQGEFDLSVFEDVPWVNNTTRYWKDAEENYTLRNKVNISEDKATNDK